MVKTTIGSQRRSDIRFVRAGWAFRFTCEQSPLCEELRQSNATKPTAGFPEK